MSSNKKNTKVHKKNSQSRRKKTEENKNSRVQAIICSVVAIILFLLILIPGRNLWSMIRNFFFGLFGICVILVPIVFGYLTVMIAKEKVISHLKSKIILCSSILLLTESLVFLIASASKYENTNYFAALGGLYADVIKADMYYPVTGGFISGLVGYPMLLAFGKAASICVCLVVLIALVLIICKISLNDIGRAAKKARKRVVDHYEFKKQKEEKRETVQRTPFNEDVFNTSIDIPIDTGKKTRKRKSEIDITIDDDAKVADATKADDLLNVIKMANQNYGEGADNIASVVADEVSETKTLRRKKAGAKQADPQTVPIEETKYSYPPIGLLKLANNSGVDGESEMRLNAQKLVSTLESFGVRAEITHISRGPSVTRYELCPAPGVKISKITNLSDDIALNLAANGVRIEAPIPGKAAVGIEVPNKAVNVVSMRELIDSKEFEEGESKLTCVLGKDISGRIITTDLAKMPHLLIAGTTGSGKSVCVNSLLISILYKATPDEVKLLLIDPKMVEFSKYKGIPHLLVPVVSDAKKAAGALNWAVSEMLNRYKIFSEYECKDIDSYNKLIESNLAYMKDNPPQVDEDSESDELVQPVLEINGLPVAKEKMPRIVIAIDELADLMMAAPSEVEESIARLAQMARAAGMHLVIATQRPSVNVITGLIKANIPSRISLKVSSQIDSRTILDAGGAEKLIGKGDMLYSPVGCATPTRVQGCFATDEEIEGVTSYIKKSYSAQYNAEIEEKIKRIAAEDINSSGGGDDGNGDIDVDSKMEEAIKLVIEAGQASTSMLQRRLKVGYARAGRMIDDMEQLGIVGPSQGSKPRDVLMTYNDWLERNNILGNED